MVKSIVRSKKLISPDPPSYEESQNMLKSGNGTATELTESVSVDSDGQTATESESDDMESENDEDDTGDDQYATDTGNDGEKKNYSAKKNYPPLSFHQLQFH